MVVRFVPFDSTSKTWLSLPPPSQFHLLSEPLVAGSDRYSKQHKRNPDLKTEQKWNFTPSGQSAAEKTLTKKHRLHKSCRLLRAKTLSGAKQAQNDLYFSSLMLTETQLLLQGSLVKGWSRGWGTLLYKFISILLWKRHLAQGSSALCIITDYWNQSQHLENPSESC